MTAQAGDSIIINGHEHTLCVLPLEILFEVMPNRPHFEASTSANWRDTFATWKIDNDRLWLAGISGSLLETPPTFSIDYKQHTIEMRQKQQQTLIAKMQSLRKDDSGNYISDMNWRGSLIPEVNGFVDLEAIKNIVVDRLLDSNVSPLQAAWYSGLLQIPIVEAIYYVHGGFHTEFEKELQLFFWCCLRSRTPGPPPFSSMDSACGSIARTASRQKAAPCRC